MFFWGGCEQNSTMFKKTCIKVQLLSMLTVSYHGRYKQDFLSREAPFYNIEPPGGYTCQKQLHY